MQVKPQIQFGEAVKTCLTEKYCCFKGRARRSEYWWYCLAIVIASYVVSFVGGLISPDFSLMLSGIFSLAVLLPGLGVAVRRLHDVGKSGWWYLIILVPLVGAIYLIYLYASDGKPEANKWGESPKYILD